LTLLEGIEVYAAIPAKDLQIGFFKAYKAFLGLSLKGPDRLRLKTSLRAEISAGLSSEVRYASLFVPDFLYLPSIL